MSAAIAIDNVSKLYRLGQLGTGTLSQDIARAWAKLRGKDDPYAMVGEKNDREVAGGGDHVWALKDVNLEVESGEVLGIIGPNGAGKSTLLKLLSRITAPTTGTIRATGRIASLLEVGTGFHPELTGRENIYLNGAILGMSRHEVTTQLDAIVSFSGCAKYLDTPVKRYSSGMKVRLGFAVAAHLECEILIVDEVLAVGDAEFREKSMGKMKQVASNGRTVLLVSHNLGVISSICRKAVLIKNGTIEDQGSAKEVVRHYLEASASNPENAAKEEHGIVFRDLKIDSSGLGMATKNIFDKIEFTFSYELKSPDDYSAFVVFKNADGVPTASYFQKDDEICSLASDKQNATLIIDANLRPGDYYVTIGALDSNGKVACCYKDYTKVVVEPLFAKTLTSFDHRLGEVYLPGIVRQHVQES